MFKTPAKRFLSFEFRILHLFRISHFVLRISFPKRSTYFCAIPNSIDFPQFSPPVNRAIRIPKTVRYWRNTLQTQPLPMVGFKDGLGDMIGQGRGGAPKLPIGRAESARKSIDTLSP